MLRALSIVTVLLLAVLFLGCQGFNFQTDCMRISAALDPIAQKVTDTCGRHGSDKTAKICQEVRDWMPLVAALGCTIGVIVELQADDEANAQDGATSEAEGGVGDSAAGQGPPGLGRRTLRRELVENRFEKLDRLEQQHAVEELQPLRGARTDDPELRGRRRGVLQIEQRGAFRDRHPPYLQVCQG